MVLVVIEEVLRVPDEVPVQLVEVLVDPYVIECRNGVCHLSNDI